MPRDSNQQPLRIGALARAAGVSPDTLRHYERLGLLAVERRTTGGYREYSPAAVRRVNTIQAALAIGFTLKELGFLFRERAAGRPPCARARELAAGKLDELGDRIARLSALRRALAGLLQEWDQRLLATGKGEVAGLLDSLARRPLTPPARARRTVLPRVERRRLR